MKVKFSFHERNYIAPSKKEAYNFLSYWQHVPFPKTVRRLDVTWNLEHVELAPSYGQLIAVQLDKVEYK